VNGTATRAYEIAKRLVKKHLGVRLFVITPYPTRPFSRFHVDFRLLYRSKLNENIYVIRIWSYQPVSSNPSIFERLLNYIIFPILALPIIMVLGALSRKVIIVIPPSPLTIIVPFIKLLRRKVIIDVTDLWHEEAQYLGYVKSRLLIAISRGAELLALKLAHAITIATYSIGKYYMNLLGNRKHIYVLPTPIDELLAEKCKSAKVSSIRDVLYDTIVYAGNFGKPQALDFAIRAFKILNEKGIKTKLLLIGGGEEEENLKHLVNVLKVSNIEFRAPIPREKLFNHVYPQVSAGLLPLSYTKTLFYAIPTKMYEYLMCELPIIAYGSSIEVQHLIRKWQLGVHIDKADPRELAEATIYLIRNKHLFVENIRKYVLHLMKQIDETLNIVIHI
jgi:glycosyltransferase involved in cell wall biosynthesis